MTTIILTKCCIFFPINTFQLIFFQLIFNYFKRSKKERGNKTKYKKSVWWCVPFTSTPSSFHSPTFLFSQAFLLTLYLSCFSSYFPFPSTLFPVVLSSGKWTLSLWSQPHDFTSWLYVKASKIIYRTFLYCLSSLFEIIEFLLLLFVWKNG